MTGLNWEIRAYRRSRPVLWTLRRALAVGLLGGMLAGILTALAV
jgi:hypothetical protein